ncbi:SDR family NAD(P)-dependent oxidoreductase [Streptomyces albidoflavus]
MTGAGTGIARTTARTFAVKGAHVVATDRRPGPLEATAAGPDRITPPTADITGERLPPVA